MLADYFDRQVERGVLHMTDTRAAADYFANTLPGSVRLQCVLGLREPPSSGEIKQIVRNAVAHFLHGCQTDGKAKLARPSRRGKARR